MGEIHGIYKQMQAARKHEMKIYVVCDNQGIVKMLQEQEAKVKLRKRRSILELHNTHTTNGERKKGRRERRNRICMD